MKKLFKGTVLSLMIGILSLTSATTAKAWVDVYLNVEEGQTAYLTPLGVPRLNPYGSYYYQMSWGDSSHIGTVNARFLENQNLHEFEGVKTGNVAYSVNESNPYQLEARYLIRVHSKATGFELESNGQMSRDNEIWLYEGEKTTISCITLPFNAEWENDGNLEHLNAIQGVIVDENIKYGKPPKGIVKATGRRPSWKAPAYLDLEAEGAGDAYFGLNTVGSALPTGINPGGLGQGFRVYVRKKPELKLSGTKVITTNKKIQNAISATVKSSGSTTCTWTSSNPEILEVIGNGTNAKLISKDKEGKVTITCSVNDEVTFNNHAIKHVTESYEVEVKKADILLNGIKNGDTVLFDRNKDVMEIPVSEVEGSTIKWTSSLDNVASVEYKNGKLILTKKGVGTTEIIGISSTGNVFKFFVNVKFVPETPRITSVKASYGTVVFNFDGTLYDRYELEIGTNMNNFEVMASTKSKFASVRLVLGTYHARVRSYKKINNQNVYSDYSEVVTFTVGKNGVEVVNSSKIGKTKIIKAKRKGKKVTLKLKKVKKAKGYQIKYSFSKKFKKSKKVFVKKANSKIRIKKSKKVFIKARAYKVVNGTKKYGKWSKIKKVK
jgi:hypothetical protein